MKKNRVKTIIAAFVLSAMLAVYHPLLGEESKTDSSAKIGNLVAPEKTSFKSMFQEFGVADFLSYTRDKINRSGNDETELKINKLAFKASYSSSLGNYAESIKYIKEMKKLLTDNTFIDYKLAEAYNNAGSVDESVKTLDAILKKDPKFIPALQLRALIADSANDRDKSFEIYNTILKYEPDNLFALENLLEYFFRDKANLDKTIEIGNKILQIDQRNLYTNLVLGSTYSLKGDVVNANKNLDKVVRLRPDLIWRVLQIGEVLQNGGQTNEAYLLFKNLFIKNPKNEQVRQKFEQTFYQVKLKEGAIKIDEQGQEGKIRIAEKLDKELMKNYEAIIAENPASSDLKEVYARKLFESRNFEQAGSIAKKILKTSPQNYAALSLLGQIEFANKNYDEALNYFNKAISQDPEDPELYNFISIIYEKNNESGQIEQLLKNAFLMHPENDKFALLLANFYYNKHQIDEALKYFEKVDELAPLSLDNIQKILGIYMQENDEAKLKDYIAKIEQRSIMEKPEALQIVGLTLLNYRRYGYALPFMQKAYDKNKNDFASALTIAQIYNKKGDFDNAFKILNDLKAKSPEEDKVKLYMFESDCFYAQKKFDKALEALYSALEKEPDSFDIYYSIISLLTEMKNFSEIPSVLDKANTNIMDKRLTDDLKAVALISEKKYEEALKIYDELISKYPEDSRYYFATASIYFDLKNPEKTEEYYRKSIAISPDNPDALNNLGYFFAEYDKNLEEAKSLIDSALKLKPYAGYILDSMGWVCYKLNDLENSKRYFLRAMSLSDEDSELYLHISMLYDKLGDKAKSDEFKQKSDQIKAKKESQTK